MIELIGVEKRYRNETVTFTDKRLEKGLWLLLGRNGAGKTTLLRIIAGLLPYAGTCKVRGSVMLAEEKVALPPLMRLGDYLKTLERLSGTTGRKRHLLSLFGLTGKEMVLMKDLSLGMRRKVQLTAALMEERAIYLLDEPMNGLDHASRAALVAYLENLDALIVLTTHHETQFTGVKKRLWRL